jgi:hypothetical protein
MKEKYAKGTPTAHSHNLDGDTPEVEHILKPFAAESPLSYVRENVKENEPLQRSYIGHVLDHLTTEKTGLFQKRIINRCADICMPPPYQNTP